MTTKERIENLEDARDACISYECIRGINFDLVNLKARLKEEEESV